MILYCLKSRERVRGVSAILSYQKQFKRATKKLTNTDEEILQVDEQIELLTQRKKQLLQKREKDQQNKVETGLMHFSNKNRTELLDQAKELLYSESAVERLRAFDDAQWNMDNVNINVINDFEALEEYVRKHTPPWKKSIFTKIGKEAIPNE